MSTSTFNHFFRNYLTLTEETSEALIRVFSFLGVGSSLFHASESDLGATLDFYMIAILSYASHQATVENLRALGASPVITDLNATARALSGVEMVDSVSDMFLTKPVQEWDNRTRSIDVPDYVVSFSGIVCSALSLALDDATVDALAQFLLDLFGVEQEFQDFILNDYLPEVRHPRFRILFQKSGNSAHVAVQNSDG